MTLVRPLHPEHSRMLVAGFALAGALIALYLVLYSLGLSPLVCPTTGCEAVQASPYSKWFGVPVAAFGLAWFLLVMLVAVTGLWVDHLGAIRVQGLLIAMTAFGLLAYIPLTALEVFVIHAVCFWCVISSLMMLGAFGAAWAGGRG